MIDGAAMLVFGPLADAFPPAFRASLSRELRIMDSPTKAQAWIARSLLFLGAFTAVSFLGALYAPLWWLLFVGIVVSSLHLMYPSWKAGVVVDDIRSKLPAALLSSASSIQAGQTPEEVMAFLSKRAEPPLDSLFSKTVSLSTRERMELGESLQKVLSVFQTPEFDRMAGLLATGIQSGANLHSLFNTAARDLLSIRELRNEQVSQMAGLKYTLFLAGILLIPSILALSVNVSGLLGRPASGLLLASELSFIPFSVVLSATIAFFCDFNPKKTLLYVPVFALLQFFVFMSVLVLFPKV